MPQQETEWVRLPGLFRWKEVCAVFAFEAGLDDEWRFSVHQVVLGEHEAEAFYVVYAASRSRVTERGRARVHEDVTPSA